MQGEEDPRPNISRNQAAARHSVDKGTVEKVCGLDTRSSRPATRMRNSKQSGEQSDYYCQADCFHPTYFLNIQGR